MDSKKRLKILVQRGRMHVATLCNIPLDVWQGYKYGRKFTTSNQPAPGSTSRTWLEKYFDEVTSGPGVWKWRHYFPIYDRHFSKFRGREVHILEVGVFSGGSLRMWHSYFGDKAHVYGVDIEPACRSYEDDRTRIFIGDQSDKNFWKAVIKQIPKLDIVIDDGGHRSFQQIATLEVLLPHLQPGGVYLCEDVHGSFNAFQGYVEGLSRSLHALKRTGDDNVLKVNELQRAVDSVHIYPFIVVIERRADQLKQFKSPKHGAEWQSFWDVEFSNENDAGQPSKNTASPDAS
jgi:hypothetical protein